VGSSTRIGLRAANHLTLLKGNYHINHQFQAAYNENPNFNKVFYVTKTREDAYDVEQALINHYAPTGLLLNLAMDARISNKGRVYDAAHRQRLSERMKGAVVSEEVRKKISAALTGRITSDLTKQILSTQKKGKPQPESIAEMCRARNRARSKKVSINGIVYASSREAARQNNTRADTTRLRLKSNSPQWKDWFYV
jgi:group I intron endonuclease